MRIPAGSAEQWEEDIENEIWDANAALLPQMKGRHRTAINGKQIIETADALGIDPERAHRIIGAAQAGVDWHNAIFDLERHGMDRSSAESVHRAAGL